VREYKHQLDMVEQVVRDMQVQQALALARSAGTEQFAAVLRQQLPEGLSDRQVAETLDQLNDRELAEYIGDGYSAFCETLTDAEVLALRDGDSETMTRVWGNYQRWHSQQQER
jgi:hypothetical protein